MDMYILDAAGEPVKAESVLAWGQWFQTGNRHVGFETLDKKRHVYVSTIFLGIDHGFGFFSKALDGPVLWETMTFFPGSKLDHSQYRYASREDALFNHEKLVRHARHQYVKLNAKGPLRKVARKGKIVLIWGRKHATRKH